MTDHYDVIEPEFEALLGDDPRLELVAETDAHEGPLRRTKADFDPTTEQARAAWMAASVPQPVRG